MLYIERQSTLHELHPLTKLALSGLAFVAAAGLPGAGTPLLVFAALSLIAIWGGVGLDYLRSAGQVIWPFALSLFLIQGFFGPGSQLLLRLGPFALKLEGLQLAARYTARLLGWFGAGLLLMLTTRPDRLMTALSELGLPHSLAYMVLTSLQIIPRFQSKAGEIIDAQRSRGMQTEGNLLKRARGLPPLVTPLILGSLAELEQRAIALEARAFSRNGPRTSLIQLRDDRMQRIARWAMLVLALAVIAWRVAVLLWA